MNRPGLLLGIVLLYGSGGGLRHELAVCLPEQMCRALPVDPGKARFIPTQ